MTKTAEQTFADELGFDYSSRSNVEIAIDWVVMMNTKFGIATQVASEFFVPFNRMERRFIIKTLAKKGFKVKSIGGTAANITKVK